MKIWNLMHKFLNTGKVSTGKHKCMKLQDLLEPRTLLSEDEISIFLEIIPKDSKQRHYEELYTKYLVSTNAALLVSHSQFKWNIFELRTRLKLQHYRIVSYFWLKIAKQLCCSWEDQTTIQPSLGTQSCTLSIIICCVVRSNSSIARKCHPGSGGSMLGSGGAQAPQNFTG